MDLNRLSKDLEGIPTETLTKLVAWITVMLRLERAATGNIMSANEVARLFTIEITQRVAEAAPTLLPDITVGQGTGEVKGFLDTPTIPKQVTGE